MASTISDYSRTNSQETSESDTNCIVATIQFRKLSKRQKWILRQLMEYGCLNFEDICYWCEYLEARDIPSDGFSPATSKEQIRKNILSNMISGARMHVDEGLKQSIYRSMRELEKRDLAARLEHQKPTIWTWIDWRKGKPQLGFSHETGAFNSDNKLWKNGTFRSAHHQWGRIASLSTKELKRNAKYYDKLTYKALSKAAHYKVEAEKRGLLAADKWIDE